MLAPNITSEAKQQDDLADRIRQVHDHVRRTSVEVLTLALAAGDLLLEAKSQVHPKRWGHWLRENCFMGRSTARLYVRLAQHRTEIEDEVSRFPDLSLRAARRLITAKTSKPSAEKAATETSTAAPAPTLLEVWNAASDEARRAFLEQVGVPGLLAVLSDSMKSDLAKRSFGAAASSSALSEKEKRKLKSIGRKVSTQRLREIPPEGNA